MTQEEKTQLEERIVDVLKTVYDPEIPVNIYDLGMIYKIDVQEDGSVDMDMTFTAPNCPAADFILEDVRTKVESVDGITTANVNLVFEPAWDQSMMSEEAKVELGLEKKKKRLFLIRCALGVVGYSASKNAGETTGKISGLHQGEGCCYLFVGGHVRLLVRI